ncbi:V-type proton ATPase subunit e2 [Drosophila navojoa]|uniref:V-type proton ATPase subunit e2 n=1 Tax=Drosophila navojoa TaxID=7232 RepID=UPI0008475588|nr:V-type proton ATPase subunit e2 [Drosophila navojoa]
MNKYISLITFTVFWALFAIIGCIIAICFKERSIIRCCVLLTAACCWIVWLVTFVMQMNPLVGPRMHRPILMAMMSYWKRSYIHDMPDP